MTTIQHKQHCFHFNLQYFRGFRRNLNLFITKRTESLSFYRVADKDWGADFRKLSAGAALVGLTLWLDHMQASFFLLTENKCQVVCHVVA